MSTWIKINAAKPTRNSIALVVIIYFPTFQQSFLNKEIAPIIEERGMMLAQCNYHISEVYFSFLIFSRFDLYIHLQSSQIQAWECSTFISFH